MATYNYLVGIYVTEEEAKSLDSKYLTELNGKPVLRLSRTFNTKLLMKRGNIVNLTVEEIWRHYKKGKYHYSLHKPNVRGIVDKGLSTIDDLEDAVMSRGIEVIHSDTFAHQDKEGKEVIDFPQRMQKEFKEVKDKNAWMPFSINLHFRGHKIKEGEKDYSGNEIPERYKYRLNSLHHDVSMLVSDKIKLKENEKFNWNDKRFKEGYSAGMVILSPTTTDKEDPDDFVKGKKARAGGIRFLTKSPEPVERLHTHCITPIGSRGSTPSSPGVLVIVAKGHYRVIEVDDHRLRIEYKCDKGKVDTAILDKADKEGILIERTPPENLKDLNGMWQYQIAHIEDRHVMLLRYMGKDKLEMKVEDLWELKENKPHSIKKDGASKEDILKIGRLTEEGKFRSTISKEVKLAKMNVYTYQKLLGLL